MIRNIQLKHAGKYVCTVQTSVDQLSAAADLIVRGIVGGGGLVFSLKIVPGHLLLYRLLKPPAVENESQKRNTVTRGEQSP